MKRLLPALCLLLTACVAPDIDDPVLLGEPSAWTTAHLPTTIAGGDMELHFTTPGVSAESAEEPLLDDAVAALFDEAADTIDLSLFEFDRQVLVDAVVAAHERGVTVRFVGDGDEIHDDGYEELSAAGVELVLRKPRDRIQHNKFAVVDGEWVVTGSTNFSENGLLRNNNGSVLIRSADLAVAYTEEFEQMFEEGKFGRKKVEGLAARRASLAGEDIEVFFSPADEPHEVLLDLLAEADLRVYFAIFSFTRADVAAEMIRLHEAGVEVIGVFDVSQARSRYSQVSPLAKAGVPVFLDGNENSIGFAGGKLHHKVLLVDALSDSDPTVTIGSYNWSGAASQYNDENLVVVEGPETTTAYLDEFCRILEHATPHPDFEGVVHDPCAGLQQQVRINEIQANPVGRDAGAEWVELVNAGAGPVDLTGWTLGDASDPARHTFGAYTLKPGAAVVVSAGAGAGGASPVVASSGRLSLGNNHDEVVLTNALGAVIDRVAYVSATSGVSFNRDPDGSLDGAFVEHDAAAGASGTDSPGLQVTQAPWGGADVLINEVMPNPDGTDGPNEWIEIVNAGDAPVDLAGWTLGDITNPARHVFGSTSLAPGGGLVIFGSGPHPEVPGSLVSSTGNLGLTNGADTITLRNGIGQTVDTVSWAGSASGISLNRAADADTTAALVPHPTIGTGNASPGTWADGSPFGAQVIVNELMPNPAGSDSGNEWVELVNLSAFPATLDGWTLGDAVNPNRHVFAAGTTLAAGESLVLFDSGAHPEVEGSITASTGTLSLNNASDQVRLRDASGTARSAVSWSGAPSGVSLNRAVDGAADALLIHHDAVPGAAGASSPGERADGTAWAAPGA